MMELTNSPILMLEPPRPDHVGKIRLEEQADQRVDDVLHQRGDDGGEGTADDNAHCHVQHVAAHGKRLELFKELFDAAFFLFHR